PSTSLPPSSTTTQRARWSPSSGDFLKAKSVLLTPRCWTWRSASLASGRPLKRTPRRRVKMKRGAEMRELRTQLPRRRFFFLLFLLLRPIFFFLLNFFIFLSFVG